MTQSTDYAFERLQDAFEYHKTESARKGERISALEIEIGELRAHVDRLSALTKLAATGNAKSFNTLLKLVGGMATAIYGFDAASSRTNVVSQIQNDLDLKGINLDADTIRKWLREAVKVLNLERIGA